MITFLCGCPEFGRKVKSLTVFQLSCLCISRFPASIPGVRFGSAIGPSQGPDLSEVKKPLQMTLFSSKSESKELLDSSSVSGCLELLEKFVGTALRSGFDAWGYVNFHDKKKILKTLSDG